MIVKPNWHNLRSTKPISTVFGFDRGTPIDRYYIERFLRDHADYITGNILEIAEDTYTKKYGKNILHSDILHVDGTNKNATIIGDLTLHTHLPHGRYNNIICTQTLNFIFDSHAAIEGIYALLAPGGVALVTVAGLCQISRYDMDRWGDYWRFTTLSIGKLFMDIFGEGNIEVLSYGNVLSAIALLEGITVEELTPRELDVPDEDYQITIGVIANKPV